MYVYTWFSLVILSISFALFMKLKLRVITIILAIANYSTRKVGTQDSKLVLGRSGHRHVILSLIKCITQTLT